ncbi:TorF family putative porin [Massilia sp. SR12]
MKRFTWLALLASASVQAQEAPAAAPSLTTTVTFASQYVSRGIRQTWDKPALQVGVDYVHPSGFVAGTWASNVSDSFVEKAKLEWDLYAGYSASAGDVGYSVILYQYLYPGAKVGATGTTFNYTELSLGLTYKAFYAKYNYTVSPHFFGIPHGRGTGYLDVGMNHDLGAGYTLNLHAGDARVGGAGNEIWDWRDAKVGVTKAFEGGWSVAGAVTRGWGATGVYRDYTNGVPDAAGRLAYSNTEKATFVVTIAKTF